MFRVQRVNVGESRVGGPGLVAMSKNEKTKGVGFRIESFLCGGQEKSRWGGVEMTMLTRGSGVGDE